MIGLIDCYADWAIFFLQWVRFTELTGKATPQTGYLGSLISGIFCWNITIAGTTATTRAKTCRRRFRPGVFNVFQADREMEQGPLTTYIYNNVLCVNKSAADVASDG